MIGIEKQRDLVDALTERELLRSAQAGDGTAFDLLVRSRIGGLGRQLHRHARSSADAEDILQETLLRAWRHLITFRGEARLSTWLYRIAHNMLLNFYARRQPHFVSTDADDEAEGASAVEPADPDTPDGALEAREECERLVRAFDALPRALARALFLRELEGLSYDEIARHECVPVGTVRSRMNRARKGLGLKSG